MSAVSPLQIIPLHNENALNVFLLCVHAGVGVSVYSQSWGHDGYFILRHKVDYFYAPGNVLRTVSQSERV